MRVKLLTNLGSNDFPDHPFMDGEEYDVSAELGAKLLALRLAVDVTPEPVPVPKQEPAAIAAPATAPKFKTSKEK